MSPVPAQKESCNYRRLHKVLDVTTYYGSFITIDTRVRTTINESTRRGWPLDIPPVCTMDAACMRDVEDAVPYAKDAVLS